METLDVLAVPELLCWARFMFMSKIKYDILLSYGYGHSVLLEVDASHFDCWKNDIITKALLIYLQVVKYHLKTICGNFCTGSPNWQIGRFSWEAPS